MASPVLLPIAFRGIAKTIGCPADAPFEELEDLLTALFLREEESAAGIRPAGFVLPEDDVFVSLRTACADLQLLSASSQSIRLVVSFSQGTDEDEPGACCCACERLCFLLHLLSFVI